MKIKLISSSPFRADVEIDDKEGLFDTYSSALHCTHSFNRNSYYVYFLPCQLLHITKTGNAKIEVLSRHGKKYIRYVSPSAIWKKEICHENL